MGRIDEAMNRAQLDAGHGTGAAAPTPSPSPSPMTVRAARFSGAAVAECPDCGAVCAYWDESDLDDAGRLMCTHDAG